MADAIPVHNDEAKVAKKVVVKPAAADPDLIADLTEQIEAKLRAEMAQKAPTADATYRGAGAEIMAGIVRVDN